MESYQGMNKRCTHSSKARDALPDGRHSPCVHDGGGNLIRGTLVLMALATVDALSDYFNPDKPLQWSSSGLHDDLWHLHLHPVRDSRKSDSVWRSQMSFAFCTLRRCHSFPFRPRNVLGLSQNEF